MTSAPLPYATPPSRGESPAQHLLPWAYVGLLLGTLPHVAQYFEAIFRDYKVQLPDLTKYLLMFTRAYFRDGGWAAPVVITGALLAVAAALSPAHRARAFVGAAALLQLAPAALSFVADRELLRLALLWSNVICWPLLFAASILTPRPRSSAGRLAALLVFLLLLVAAVLALVLPMLTLVNAVSGPKR